MELSGEMCVNPYIWIKKLGKDSVGALCKFSIGVLSFCLDSCGLMDLMLFRAWCILTLDVYMYGGRCCVIRSIFMVVHV